MVDFSKGALPASVSVACCLLSISHVCWVFVVRAFDTILITLHYTYTFIPFHCFFQSYPQSVGGDVGMFDLCSQT